MASWEDDSITLNIDGQRVTIAGDSESIVGLMARKEERVRYREE